MSFVYRQAPAPLPPLRAAIRRAINDSFVEGFRYIMLIGAGLSVAGAITSLLLIEGKRGRLGTESISAQEDSRPG